MSQMANVMTSLLARSNRSDRKNRNRKVMQTMAIIEPTPTTCLHIANRKSAAHWKRHFSYGNQGNYRLTISIYTVVGIWTQPGFNMVFAQIECDRVRWVLDRPYPMVCSESCRIWICNSKESIESATPTNVWIKQQGFGPTVVEYLFWISANGRISYANEWNCKRNWYSLQMNVYQTIAKRY